MSLGDIVAAHRGDTQPGPMSVLADIEAAFSKRPPDHRAEGWHPSQLMDMCPRLEVLQQLMPDLEGAHERIDTRTQMIFDVGTALHAWWQEQYFGPMGVLKGNWKCARCDYTTSMTTMPTRSHLCGSTCADGSPVLAPTSAAPRVGGNSLWRFAEVPVKSDKWGIVGHSDGIYLLRGPTGIVEAVLEIKTAGPSFWARGGIPYAANIFQINIYMWLTGTTKGILLYIDKGGVNKELPMMCKEVLVDYNDTHRKDACAKIELYRDAVTAKTLPPRMAMCELRPRSAKPSKCPYSRICLSDAKAATVEKAWGSVKMR